MPAIAAHGKVEGDEARGIIQQRLALQDMHEAARKGRPLRMPDSATASVGDRTAASAKAAARGTKGNRICTKLPTPNTVKITRPKASAKTGTPNSRQLPFRNAVGVRKQQRRNEEKKKQRGIEGDVKAERSQPAPTAICSSGRGTRKTVTARFVSAVMNSSRRMIVARCIRAPWLECRLRQVS